MKYSIDGNQVCATYPDFRDLQQDVAGFGDSLKEALLDLIRQRELKSDDVDSLELWEIETVKLPSDPPKTDTPVNYHDLYLSGQIACREGQTRGYNPVSRRTHANGFELWDQGWLSVKRLSNTNT